MKTKAKKILFEFLKGFLLATSIGIASKLIVMLVFSEAIISWFTFLISLFCAAIPSGIYRAQSHNEVK